jgi:hypothetical protein
MPLVFSALPTETVAAYRAGAPDANGQPPEIHVAAGRGNPCRHCLGQVPEGARMLVLAHRPFPRPQPYAEVGPIFLCADPCERHPDSPRLPAMFAGWERMLVRGYGADDRIVYGSGQVVETARLEPVCEELLSDPRIAYLHLRSASNNCYHGRVERGLRDGRNSGRASYRSGRPRPISCGGAQ